MVETLGMKFYIRWDTEEALGGGGNRCKRENKKQKEDFRSS